MGRGVVAELCVAPSAGVCCCCKDNFDSVAERREEEEELATMDGVGGHNGGG